MIVLTEYVPSLYDDFSFLPDGERPWRITLHLPQLLMSAAEHHRPGFSVSDGVWVHESATVEAGAILKPPILIMAGAFVGAHAYLRAGVALGRNVAVGPGCEIRASVISAGSALAHLNFIGDSIIGRNVNIEAGAVLANCRNKDPNKAIHVCLRGERVLIDAVKFGSVVGDDSKIGANAVLAPGTLLPRLSVVERGQLVDRDPRG